ncbi:hypothetical protein NBRC10512_005713 [Rhodotorula toruloides]|uniref:RHTO0S02e07932g1_1 n=2 Tax=Rhodotorula toruloides TaxID=5286 RepID=A0A061AH26_RHOTO|nr:myo-inositol 2-dehydrogenase [Rhodotorula toruloides NP11]EMS19102.1 myo-inositol 2-dehydrogenase [Rhodotorula toruloides NP11]CDR36871.1 RHTO0S02e07932g1_1 [Rhodotorula toruloides]
MAPVLRIGIVGCGEVAQTTHLPTLALLSHLYKVTALCDVSPGLLQHCATKFGTEKTYSNITQLVKDPEVDVVFVLSADEYHASHAVAAADAGKHVFIEKPMALTREDAQAIIDAQERNKVVIFVGYMRRYAGAFERMKEELKSVNKIRYVTVRDIIGHNHFFVNQSGSFPVTFSDFPADASSDRLSRARKIANSALSPSQAKSEREVATYRLLGSLGSHDLSAMRELFGVPKRCIAATRSQGDATPFISALFDYGDFTAKYETGIDEVADFDAHIEVFGDNKRLKLAYDTPYVKGLPITLEIKETDSSGHYSSRTIRPTYKDAYTLELEQLYEAVVHGKPVKTDPKDAEKELGVFEMVMTALVN